MKWKVFATTVFLCLFSVKVIYAVESPIAVPNNKFGIHIHDANDLLDAAHLVNSQGGDWGYVTFVIREEERDLKKWQGIFDRMRALHLIPIVRIASNPKAGNWQKGDLDQIDDWVSFLKNIIWVTKNRYVIIGNEPNHATEWGGVVNPEEYSDYLLNFTKSLKETSDDFFIMPAGLDASAPNDAGYMDEAVFLERMIKKNPNLFEQVDGWSSHSYPNPGFSGSVTDTGRGSIRTYEWELENLRKLGVAKNLPVFITETGWIHSTEEARRQTDFGELGKHYIEAYTNVWNNPQIIAVTPFILNYQMPPFDTFSWKKKDGTFYDFYYTLQEFTKTKGTPIQENKGEIQAVLVPEVILIGEKRYGLAYIKNAGQKIWSVGKLERISVEKSLVEISPTNPLTDIKPGDSGAVLYRNIQN